MAQQLPAVVRNRLLARLAPADLDRLRPHLTLIPLAQRTPLVTPGEPIPLC